MPAATEMTTLDAGRPRRGRGVCRARWTRYDLRGGRRRRGVWSSTANLYIQQVAPWALAKAGREAELDAALAALGRALYRLAVLACPFIPGKAQAIWQSLGLSLGGLATARGRAWSSPQWRAWLPPNPRSCSPSPPAV